MFDVDGARNPFFCFLNNVKLGDVGAFRGCERAHALRQTDFGDNEVLNIKNLWLPNTGAFSNG